MRLLLVTPFSCDDPTFHGVMTALARAYRARGHEAIVAGQRDPSLDKPEREATPWGRILRLGGRCLDWQRRSSLTRRQLDAALRGVDFAHVHFIGYAHSNLAALHRTCRRRGVPMGATFQDFGNPPRPRSRADAAVVERFLRECAWVTAVSAYVAAKAAAAFPFLAGRLRVIPNAVDLGELATPRPRGGRGAPFVLCVGRLAPYKGIDVLLLAWRDAAERMGTAKLVICGGDHAGGHYQRMARELGLSSSVRFRGLVGRAKIPALLRAARFCVLPSRQEAFGIAALEGMACGKAVLATAAGGPQEFIEHGRTGWLVPPRDVASLSRGLLRLSRDAALRRRLGRRAEARTRRFDVGAIADRYLDLAAGAIARP